MGCGPGSPVGAVSLREAEEVTHPPNVFVLEMWELMQCVKHMGQQAGRAVTGERAPRKSQEGPSGPPELNPRCAQGLALTHVLEHNLKPAAGLRPEAAKVVILVTDGKSQDDAHAAGQVLKDRDVDVFAVGEQPQTLARVGVSPGIGGSLYPASSWAGENL